MKELDRTMEDLRARFDPLVLTFQENTKVRVMMKKDTAMMDFDDWFEKYRLPLSHGQQMESLILHVGVPHYQFIANFREWGKVQYKRAEGEQSKNV